MSWKFGVEFVSMLVVMFLESRFIWVFKKKMFKFFIIELFIVENEF